MVVFQRKSRCDGEGLIVAAGRAVNHKNWQAIAGVSYSLTENASIALAYRIISTDYSKGAFVYDVETSGPNLGLVFKF